MTPRSVTGEERRQNEIKRHRNVSKAQGKNLFLAVVPRGWHKQPSFRLFTSTGNTRKKKQEFTNLVRI